MLNVPVGLELLLLGGALRTGMWDSLLMNTFLAGSLSLKLSTSLKWSCNKCFNSLGIQYGFL